MHKTMLLITDASLDDSANVIYTCLHPIIIGKTASKQDNVGDGGGL